MTDGTSSSTRRPRRRDDAFRGQMMSAAAWMTVWTAWPSGLCAASSQPQSLETGASPPALPDFGALLLQTVVSLALVCALAYVVLNYGLGRWLKAQQAQTRHLELLASLPLGPRRNVHLVKAVDKVLVIGASEAGLQSLGELNAAALEQLEGVREESAEGK